MHDDQDERPEAFLGKPIEVGDGPPVSGKPPTKPEATITTDPGPEVRPHAGDLSREFAQLDQELRTYLSAQKGIQKKYVPWGLHEAAEDMRNAGVGCCLGEPFDSLDFWVRRFSHPLVQDRLQAAEREAMHLKNVDKADDLPPINKINNLIEALVDQAITHMEGHYVLTPFSDPRIPGYTESASYKAHLEFAEKWGTRTQVDGLEGVQFVFAITRDDPVNRPFLRELLRKSELLRERLFGAAKYIRDCSDQELIELGSQGVLGRQHDIDWLSYAR